MRAGLRQRRSGGKAKPTAGAGYQSALAVEPQARRLRQRQVVPLWNVRPP
jgi:hypothetical protein